MRCDEDHMHFCAGAPGGRRSLLCLRAVMAPLYRVEAQIERVQVEAEVDPAERLRALVHGTQRRPAFQIARSPPLEKIRDHTVDYRPDQGHRLPYDGVGSALPEHRYMQELRNLRPEETIDIRQMEAEQMVEQRLRIGFKVIAIPPEPVATLRRIELFPRSPQRVRRHLFFLFLPLEKSPGLADTLPRVIVFGVPQPAFEIRVDPRPTTQPCQSGRGRLVPQFLRPRPRPDA